MSSADKALRSGHDAIRQMAGRINLSNRIINRAFSLFKQCYENKCVRGRSQDAIVATCIYIACRQEGAQRTIKEICAISTSASKKDIGRCFKQIVQNLPNSNRPESIDIKNLVVSLIWKRFLLEIFFLNSLVFVINLNFIKKISFKEQLFILPIVQKNYVIFKVVHQIQSQVHRFIWLVLLLENENQ
jgi:transcription initiation factor TFIIIB Brf1 subunit/transcription initiation factor TFIIB